MFPQLPAAVRVLRPTRSTSFSTVAMRPRRPQMHVVAVVLSAGRRPGREPESLTLAALVPGPGAWDTSMCRLTGPLKSEDGRQASSERAICPSARARDCSRNQCQRNGEAGRIFQGLG